VMKQKLTSTMDRLSPQAFEFVFISAPYILPQVENVMSSAGTRMNLGKNVEKDIPKHEQEKIETMQKASFATSYDRALQNLDYAQDHRESPRNLAGINQLKEKYSSMLKDKRLDDPVTEKVKEKIFSLDGDGKRWWTIPNEVKGEGFVFIGHETSFQVISTAMKEKGPFDGVIGFSSGAMMAGYCQALLCSPTLSKQEPTFQPPASQRPFRFGLYFAPWLATHGVFGQYMEKLERISHSVSDPPPSMCFEGVKDRILVKGEWTK
jgi:hypothetical protein